MNNPFFIRDDINANYSNPSAVMPAELNPHMQMPVQMPINMNAPMAQMPMMDVNMPCKQQMPCAPCIPQETVLYNVELARAYVPFQKMCSTYSPIEGLDKGTIFPELYRPYVKEYSPVYKCENMHKK